ncbi:mechanosensitive ion channel family protein [Parvularcula sp. IMCC14364]|uniref:mechanosensitive ion channel family protein n=1 Tax=Parvularcula sp. IMCC14364 TaxID=3067902 RepID=UPI00274203C6|nr:mechanosensitive ion channel domain-containing protein [Parvularcula sp. IMCC14364]
MQSSDGSESAGQAEVSTEASTQTAAGQPVQELSPEVIAMEGNLQPVYETLEPLLGAEQAESITRILSQALVWGRDSLLTWNMLLQLGLLMGAMIPAIMFGPRLKQFIINQVTQRVPYGILKRAARALATIATPIALFITISIFIAALGAMGQSTGVMEAGRSLLSAWILVRLVTLIIQSPFWSKVAFYTIWPIMALDAFGVLDNVLFQLEQMSVTLSPGDAEQGIPAAKITLLDVFRAAIIFGLFFWLANVLSNFITSRIEKVDELNPSLKAMFSKILDLVLPIVALLLALQFVGFNLASLAIFGGAVGLGIGLGLQRLISNFAAGITLLADKSIKPGDVIEVEDTFGWITAMNTRYVAVRTRDGTEHLVPNDTFMNEGVINWSHQDKVVRIHAPFGITYGHRDVRQVQKAVEDLAVTVDRVLEKPRPRCNLVEFGDSSVNFDLRFWINDPRNGITNVRSDVMMAIWDWLHEQEIEIPFPQRDLHIRSSSISLPAEMPATGVRLGTPEEPGS